MPPPTLTARAIAHRTAGDDKAALRIAQTFRLGLTLIERATLARGYECMVRPEFYRSLGYDPQAQIAAALAIFDRKIARNSRGEQSPCRLKPSSTMSAR